MLALTAFAVMLSLVACGKKKEASVEKAAESALLEYVPADSPYVYAALAPAPDDVADKMEKLTDGVIPALKGQIDVVIEGLRTEGDPDSEQGIKILEVFSKRLTPDIAKTFGFSRKDTAVFYGNGLLPVARITVTDGDRFDAELDAIAEEIGAERTVTSIGGADFDNIALGGAGSMLIGQQDGMVVVALAPPGLDDAAIAELVGADKPAQSIADGGALSALAGKYGFVPQGLGFIDIEAIASVILDGPTGLDAKVFAATNTELPEFSDVCRAEYRGLAQIVPRLALGYQSIDASRMDMLPVMELRSDIAEALKPVAGNVPGLNTPGEGMMKFALALDLKALRGFVETQVEKIMESPYECPELGNINMGAMQAQQGLQQPLPPIAYNFRGLVLDVNSIEGVDFDNPGIPEELDLSMLLAFDNVSALLQMGQMMLPPLAAVEIAPDGKPVAIPQEMLMGYPAGVFAAMSDNLLAFSTGPGSEDRAAAMVAADAEGDSAVMAMSVDMASYMGFMTAIQNSVMEDITSEVGDSEDEEAQQAARIVEASIASNKAMQEAYGKVIDRETVHIRITENGFELPTVITLK